MNPISKNEENFTKDQLKNAKDEMIFKADDYDGWKNQLFVCQLFTIRI